MRRVRWHSWVLLALWTWSFGGCGIILFPIALPMAISQNRFYHLQGTITDEQGRSLSNAVVQIRKEHSIIYPGFLALTTTAEFKETRHLRDGRFDIFCHDQEVFISITREGYYPRYFNFGHFGNADAAGLAEAIPFDESTFFAKFPVSNSAPFNVALERIEHPAALVGQCIYLYEYKSGRRTYANLREIAPVIRSAGGKLARHVGIVYGPDDGTLTVPQDPALYIRVAREIDGAFAVERVAASMFSFCPLYTPRSVSLVCTSPGGGLIRVPTRNGRPVGGRMRTAPESGYSPEIVLTSEEMAAGDSWNELIPFYCRIGERYGRGVIFCGGNAAQDIPEHRITLPVNFGRVELTVYLYLQPDGSRNVE